MPSIKSKPAQNASLAVGALATAVAGAAAAMHITIDPAVIVGAPVVFGAVAHAVTLTQDLIAESKDRKTKQSAAIQAAAAARTAAAEASFKASVAEAVKAIAVVDPALVKQAEAAVATAEPVVKALAPIVVPSVVPEVDHLVGVNLP